MRFNPIRVARHSITDADRAAVMRVLSDDRPVARGAEVRWFEEEFADYVGAKYAVACSSGTAALHLAFMTRPNIITRVPTITFAATANAPKLADCPVSLYDNMDPGIRGAQSVVIHYAGEAYHIRDACVEDACHALGARYWDEKRVGSCPESAMTCFSFHPTKHITTGEGGMITTNDQGIRDHLLSLRDNGRGFPASTEPWRYSWDRVGLNYEMSEIAAALGRSQLKRIDANIHQRGSIAGVYYHGLPKAAKPYIEPSASYRCSYHLYPVLIDFEAIGKTRQQVMFELMRRGIETQVHYYPLHLQPMGGGKRGDHPHAEKFYDQELSLPMHQGLSMEDAQYVCNALTEVLG